LPAPPTLAAVLEEPLELADSPAARFLSRSQSDLML
jgi:hypothetical protein